MIRVAVGYFLQQGSLPAGLRVAGRGFYSLVSITSDSDVLVARVRLGERGSISEGGAQGETNGGGNGGAE